MFSFRRDDTSPEKPDESPRPAWHGPPEDELGMAVPLALVIARSEAGIVALTHATAYTTGVAFDFVAHARDLSQGEAHLLFHQQHHGLEDDEELPDGLLRIGFELSDGDLVSNLEGRRAQRRLMTGDGAPEGPVLMPYAGGGGSAGRGKVVMRPGYWLWPLPPAGQLKIACEWPIVGIPLTTAEVDAGRLVEAAGHSISLWPA